MQRQKDKIPAFRLMKFHDYKEIRELHEKDQGGSHTAGHAQKAR